MTSFENEKIGGCEYRSAGDHARLCLRHTARFYGYLLRKYAENSQLFSPVPAAYGSFFAAICFANTPQKSHSVFREMVQSAQSVPSALQPLGQARVPELI